MFIISLATSLILFTHLIFLVMIIFLVWFNYNFDIILLQYYNFYIL